MEDSGRGVADGAAGSLPDRLADVSDADEGLIDITGRGWLERKRTGGKARYWYQRWRDGKIKRSKYLAPVREA